MFVFYFCLQLSLSKGIKRPYIKETSDEDDYKQHEPIRDSETNIDIEKCLFSSLDNLEGNGGAIFISSKKKVNCTINDCKFNECKGKNGGAISVYYTEAINYGFSLNNSIFTACECTKNGGAVYIQSAQPLYHTFNIIKCTFNNNKAVLGGGLYAELRDQLNLENCQFNNNEASTKGSSAYLKLGHENIKNGVEEHDTFKIHNNIFTFSPSSSNTVNVYIENDKITDETDPAHANVYFGGNTFTIDSSSELSSGYLHLEVVENQGLFESFNFDSCNCVHQEQITVKIAPGLNLTNFNFGCTAIDTCTPNVVTPTPPPTPDAEGYTPHEPIREPTININVQKCTFNKLDNLEGNGGAILITFSKKVSCVVNDCKFNECKGSNGGAIYASYSTSTSYKFNITNTIFTACECTEKGGAVYIQSAQSLKHTFNITGCTFSGNKASYGGGLYAELRDQLNLENCHFVNNEASTKGSSAYLKLGHENIKNGVEEHDKFKVHNNAFTFNPSTNNAVNVFIENDEITDTTDPAHANVYFGGNTFNIEGSAAVEYLHLEVVQNYGGFESFTFDSCNCVHQEQSTVSIVAKPNVTSNVILYNFMFGCESIDKCTSEQPTPPPIELPTQKPTIDAGDYQNHDPIRETEATIDIKRCLFSNLENSGGNGGAILITYSKKVNCTINDCKFNECKGNNGGAIYAQYSSADDYEFSIINTIFTACECTTRGGAVYIQSAQPLHHKFDITGCTFNGNKASYGGGLYAELRDQLNLENCHFVNNEASTKGSSAYLKLGHENIKNSVEEHDTFKVHNNVFTFNPSTNNAVNVFIENDEITDTTDPAHANVYFGGNTFNIEGSAAVEYLHLEVVQNYGGFESFTFDSCNCVHQEQSTVSIVAKPNVTSNVILYNFMFGCESIDKCTSEQPTPPPIELPTQKPTIDAGDYQNHDPIRETEATIDIKRCLFSNLENSGGNGGAILITYSKKVNCTINDCKFNECKGNNGGAIYAQYSSADDYEFSIINTIFTACECTTRGGAVYIQSAQPLHHKFDITGCTFNGNKASYGGGLYAELRDQLNLENCHFVNNEASTKGSSAYLKLGHENIKNSVEEHDTFKVHNNVFTFNPSTNNAVNVFIENDEITDTTDPAHANVYFGGNTFNIEGSAAVEYLHLEVVQNYGGFESFTFDSCNCVHQEQSTVSIVAKPNVTSNVILYNFMFGCESIDKCTSEQPTPPPIELPTQKPTIDAGDYQNHDPIRETEATIDIKRCLFSNLENSGGNGGAILITYSKKVNCTINDCKFNECKGNNGGAIYAQYSSADDYEFSIINTIFTACECTTRGGAVYIQSAQPLHHKFDITGCTFNGNKASYGGGLYAELRDQLNLENCHFNSNEASTKGSSAYLKLGHENIKNGVEEHDTFKVHNNVFTFKPSSNDAVNLYVENDGITDERDPAHANVFHGGNTFNIESSSESSTKYLHFEVVENAGGFESFTFDSCNCVHQDQSTVSISSNIRLYNFNFGCTSIDKCTSEQPTVLPTEPPTPDAEGYTPHDPIRETTANIELTKSLFNSLGNLALDGGAILISYSKKVNCAINDCKFNNCKAKNGGAIAASYSSAVDYSFKISQTIFSGCQADSRGGAVYIQSAQPLHHTFGITGCTFSGNKAYFGGGLYAELRDQLNLENCHFVNNEASKKGSSAYLKLGHENIKNSVEEHDTFKVHNNVFTFNPSTNNAVNVFIENDEITDTTDPAHANVYFGGNTFNIGSSRIARSEYLHLEIVENEGGFESITFDSCNCVKQGQSTVKVAENYQLNNFNFECTSIDTCTPNAGDTSTSSSSSISSESSSSSSISSESSSSSSISSESSSSSDVDKNINDSNQKNKSKIALTIGIAVAAVVVVVVIVVVVIIVIRKKSFGNYVHADEDDIAENLNGPSSNIELNNQDSAL